MEIVKKVSAALLLAALVLLNVLLAEGEAEGFRLLRLAVDGLTHDLITLPYIQVVLHRSSNVTHTVSPRPILNLPLVYTHLQVALIPHQKKDRIGTFSLGRLVPFSGGGDEGGRLGEVEYQHDSLAAIEVRCDDGTVLLLSSSVPDA